MNRELQNLFYPKSICVVGASAKELSIGYEILRSIKLYSFKGKVYPVNPKADKILDYDCYKSVLDINEKIDAAIVVVPKQFVDESLDQLILKKVTSIILITAGFGETGEAGKKLEKKLIERIQSNRIRLVGPNCMGIINTLDEIKLNATFVAEKPEKGGIGFLSQSGALGAAVLNSLRETNIKFAHFVSVGNKIDITENDILKFWLKDKNINVLTFYLESIERGIEFISDFRNSAKKKPIIILKAGKTESGMKAASSHTGALSNNDRIINSLFKQFGIIRAENLNETFNTAKGFEFFPLPKGNRIAVITNAGGPAILAVDKIENRNLKLAEITESTKNKLKKIVHPEGSINNPIDLLPGGTPEVYKNVNEIVLKDKNVDAVISIFVEPVMVNAFNVIESVNSIISPKPIYQVCMPLPEFWQKYNTESKTRKPIFRNPEDPAEIISNVLLYQDKKKSNQKINIKIKSKDLNTSKGFLNQNEVKKISKKYNLPLVHQSILTLKQIKAKKDFTFPLVIKGLHPQVIHKSELNAVKTNIMNKKQLVSFANKIINSFQNKGYELSEFLIQPFIQIKHELLIGGFRDFSFGPIIMFGTGGKYVETLNDTQIRSAFLRDEDIDEMISETKIGKILKGVRGEKGTELFKLKKIIKSVAEAMIENENILEIDLNPLIVDIQNNFHLVDIRIKV